MAHLRIKDQKPNHDLILNIMQAIALQRGILFDYKKYKEELDNYTLLRDAEFTKFREKTGITFFNMAAKKQDENHPGYIISKHCNIPAKVFTRGDGKWKFNNEIMEVIEKDYIDKPGIKELLEYKRLSSIISNSTQLEPFLENEENKGKDDRILRPTYELGETYRFQSRKPNLQGLNPIWKTKIKAREGYTLVAIDIKAQEPHIFIWGILSDIIVKTYSKELGDNYSALLKRLGRELNKDDRDKMKVAILSVMNGKSQKSLAYELQDYQLVGDFFNFLNKDEGYLKMERYVNERASKNETSTEDLFGTSRTFNKMELGLTDGQLKRKIKNGPFQITAGEILAISLEELLKFLIKNYSQTEEFVIDLLKPLMLIHDEVVFEVKDSFLEEGIEIIQNFILPEVEGWDRFKGEMKVGKYYEHK